MLERLFGGIDALIERGSRAAQEGRLEEACELLRKALAKQPANLQVRAALSDLLLRRGDHAGAAAELARLLEDRPDWADAHFNHGVALRAIMRTAEAEAAFRRAIAAEPRHAGAYRMLGGALLGHARVADALALYREARERCPGDLDLESAELFALNASDDIGDAELFARHAAFGERLQTALPARFAHSQDRDPERRLRVGYVSGDFCYHVVSLFLQPVLEEHDRSAVEVFCYSTTDRPDAVTRQLAAASDTWRDASALSPAQLADAIHADRIDLLVDLGGHSGLPQLRVFAQRPAPVQATWIGYLGTTGLRSIDWRITDAVCDPPGATERLHTEELARLPHSQWCYRPFMSPAAPGSPPSASAGYVTFGSFNQALKLSPSTRRIWAQVLQQVPGSRLVVLGLPAGRPHEELARDLGVASDRLTLMPYVSLQDYFGWLAKVDIALDTTPYSGGTTTCDALWMGVPVLTAPGTRPASRSAASILATVGLTDWIASGPADYVARAIRLAGRKDLLQELRASLRPRMQASPLMDEARFARDLESLYRRMWRRHAAQGV